MALSRVLKDFIIKEYDKKINVLTRERDEKVKILIDTWSKEQKEKAKEIMSPLLEKIKEVKTEIENNGFSLGYHLNNLYAVNHIYEVKNTPTNLKDEVKKPFDEKIDKLNKERERLLIRLSLEKDFDRISAILIEHSIEL